jgi:hypothetical protein
MFNPTTVMIDAFVGCVQDGYRAMFSTLEPSYPGILAWAARMVLERLATSDALYHNVEHTIMATLVGQEILRGKHTLVGGVSPRDWVNFMLALLCHDIGYVRGVCQGDRGSSFVIDRTGNRVTAPVGASDAFLTPYHVERAIIFVGERFRNVGWFDVAEVQSALELTRFPVPADGDAAATTTPAALADPSYMRKINCLFHEFEETGTNAKLGYRSPADLADNYAKFFWGAVRPYIGDALHYLRVTQEGQQWIANLYHHVFAVEHGEARLGPAPSLMTA